MNWKKRKKMCPVFIVIAAFTGILFSGCHKKKSDVLTDRKMIDLMVDMELGEAYIQQYSADENDQLRSKVFAGILKKHGLTQAQFDSTMNAYGRNIDHYQELYKEVDKVLEKKQKAVTGLTANQTQNINDIWPFTKYTLIDNRSEAEGINFSFTPEPLNRGSRLEWSFRISGSQEGELMICVEYDKGAMSYVSQSLYGNEKSGITLQTDSARDIKRIFGYLVLNESRIQSIRIDSISLTHQPLDSMQYYRYRGQRKYYAPTSSK